MYFFTERVAWERLPEHTCLRMEMPEQGLLSVV